MLRDIFRLLSILGDTKAASRGSGPFVRRQVRKRANRVFNRGLRKVIKP